MTHHSKRSSTVPSPRPDTAQAPAQRSGRKAARRTPPTDISSAAFDPKAPELVRSWHSGASSIICLNPYPNGVTLSTHAGEPESAAGDVRRYLPGQFNLRTAEMRDYLPPTGKYFLFKENFAQTLERRLIQLRDQRQLAGAVLYFGTVNDPFANFHKKFNVTMSCLRLLEHYQPGLVVIQTRSPMVISALPTLKALGQKVVVGVPIESKLESAVARYMPGHARIADRLIAADGLRKQGIKVNLIASPVLPYGDVNRDAWDFADLLDNHADYISLGCLACGRPSDEAQLRALPVARRLVADKQYRWLRPHAYRSLYFALKVLAPEKLLLPARPRGEAAQLDLFAAA